MKSNIQLKNDALESLGKDKWGISIGGFLIYIIITQAIGLIPFIGAIAGFILSGPFVVGLYFFFLKVSRGDHVEIEDLFVAFKNKNQFLAALVAFLLIIAIIFPTIIVSIVIWIFLIIGKESIEKIVDTISHWSDIITPFGGNPFGGFNFQSDLPLYEPDTMAMASADLNWFVIILGFVLIVLLPIIYIGLGISQTFFTIANDENVSGLDAFIESWRLMKNKKLKLFLLELSFIGWIILSVLTLFIGFIFLSPYIYTTYAKFYDNLNESS
tara:strand:- start:1816 stop:2625 length:810 start_codon:yes stop_codon:yes gene_type:complete